MEPSTRIKRTSEEDAIRTGNNRFILIPFGLTINTLNKPENPIKIQMKSKPVRICGGLTTSPSSSLHNPEDKRLVAKLKLKHEEIDFFKSEIISSSESSGER